MTQKYEMWAIWEEPGHTYPWRVQSVNFVAQFKTEEDATKWRDAVLVYRKRTGLK